MRKATPPELHPLSLRKVSHTPEDGSKLPADRERQVIVITRKEARVMKTKEVINQVIGYIACSQTLTGSIVDPE